MDLCHCILLASASNRESRDSSITLVTASYASLSNFKAPELPFPAFVISLRVQYLSTFPDICAVPTLRILDLPVLAMSLITFKDDVVLELLKYLHPTEQVCLALTCHHFRSFILNTNGMQKLNDVFLLETRPTVVYGASRLLRELFNWAPRNYILCQWNLDKFLKGNAASDVVGYNVCQSCEKEILRIRTLQPKVKNSDPRNMAQMALDPRRLRTRSKVQS